MKALHEKRSSGQYRKHIRGKTPVDLSGTGLSEKVPDGSPWPSFWSQECETSFQKLKELAAQAVNLACPDLEGAQSGTNPFHLYPDACQYGVGAGLFQAQRTTSEMVKNSLHGILGSLCGPPRWK